MAHPNLKDKIALKLNPRYLYPGQIVIISGRLFVGICHKATESKQGWKVMDYVNIEKDSVLRYLGLAKDHNIQGEITGNYSIWEVIYPRMEIDLNNQGHHITEGDVICTHPADRKHIYAAPTTSA